MNKNTSYSGEASRVGELNMKPWSLEWAKEKNSHCWMNAAELYCQGDENEHRESNTSIERNVFLSADLIWKQLSVQQIHILLLKHYC